MTNDSTTVGDVLRMQAARRGDHPLLICDSERISYADADRLSARLSRGLIALGAGKGTHVGLLHPNGAAFVVALFAAARIGAVVIPFSTFATIGELRRQLIDSDTEILFAAASFKNHDYVRRMQEVLPGAELDSELFEVTVPRLRHVIFDMGRVERRAEGIEGGLLSAMQDDVDGSDPLTIIYTSGTSSAPKGVVHTHRALLDHQRNLNVVRNLTEDDVLFCNSPFFWIGGLAFALLAGVLAGASLVCSTCDDPSRVLDLIEAERPTVTNGFTAGVVSLTRHPSFAGRDLTSMRRGNLYPIMAPEVRPVDPELRHNMLGLTEAGSVVLICGDESDQPERRRGSFGLPAPGLQAKVVDPATGAPVQGGERGELCVRGACLMQRYYGRSREQSFDDDGWFHTGDLIAVDVDGYFYYLGRRGSMIKTAGANVPPAEVEKAIGEATDGAMAWVFGIPDPDRGQLVVAVVAGVEVDQAELRRRLSIRLSAYKIPRRIITIATSEIPLLASGKPDLRRMESLFDD